MRSTKPGNHLKHKENQTKYRNMTRKPWSHVRNLFIYRTYLRYFFMFFHVPRCSGIPVPCSGFYRRPENASAEDKACIFIFLNLCCVPTRHRTNYSPVRNPCIYVFRSHVTTLTIWKCRDLAVQTFERQNRGQIFSRYSWKFERRGVNTMTV